MSAWIGATFESDVGWNHLETLVDIGDRMAGSNGERRGAEATRAAFEDVGLRNVRLEGFDVQGWTRGAAAVRAGARAHDAIALPRSPSAEATGELVDLGYGLPSDFERDLEGKVVLAASDMPKHHDRYVHRREKYYYAVEAGAAGFIYRNHVEGCLPPTGEVGYHNRPGPIPAVGVSKEVGADLVRGCRDSPFSDPGDTDGVATGPEVTLDVDCRNEPSTSVNVEGVLGPADADEILVTAHVDAHDIAPGANDNGAGCAVIATVASLLAEESLSHRVRFVTFGAEEIGLYGAYHCADRLDTGQIRAVVNVDGAGRSRDLGVRHNGFPAIESAFEAATDALDAPLSTSDTVSPHGDQWAFVEQGVPATMVHSVDRSQRGRGWGHTHADTLDKLDPRDLGAIAVQVAEGVLQLDSEFDPVPRDPEAIQDELAPGYERELRVGGRWHFE